MRHEKPRNYEKTKNTFQDIRGDHDMLDLSGMSSNIRSVVVVGLILVEALVLYVGYGTVMKLAGPRVMDLIRSK